MVVLVNAAAFECLELPLLTKNTFQGNLSSLYIHITLCNYEGRHKNGWIQQMFNKNNVPQRNKRLNLPQLPPLGWSFPFFGHCLYSEGADLLQETSKAVSGKKAHFSKQAFVWEFSVVITAVRFVCKSQLCSFHGLGQTICTFPMWVWKRMAVGDW